MKRVAVWLLIALYLIMACGNPLDAGCCTHEATGAEDEHSAYEHVHSKVLLAVHRLLHHSVPDDTKRLSPRHCCCVNQGEEGPGLPWHSFTPKFRTNKLWDLSSWPCPPEEPVVSGACFNTRIPNSLRDFCSAYTSQSIQSTILLI